MWYLTEQCSPLETLIARDPEISHPAAGQIFDFVNGNLHQDIAQQWDALSARCCTSMPGAP